jgi:hypothetical protein
MPITKERLGRITLIAKLSTEHTSELLRDLKDWSNELMVIAYTHQSTAPDLFGKLQRISEMMDRVALTNPLGPDDMMHLGAELKHQQLTFDANEKGKLYQQYRRAGVHLSRQGLPRAAREARAPAAEPLQLSEKARIMLEAAAPMIPQKYHPILGEYVPQPPAAFSDPTLPANFLENPIDDTSGNPVPLSPPKAGAVVPSLSPDMTCRELRLTGRYSEEELMAMCDDYRAPGAPE